MPIKSLPMAEVQSLLKHISHKMDLEVVHKVIWAVVNEYGPEDGKALVLDWMLLEQPLCDEDIQALCDKPNREVTLNHLIYLARLGGYLFPRDEYESFKKRCQSRKPGQVALEDIYAGGLGLATIGNDLYKYSLTEGYYQKISDGAILKTITDYFNTYETKTGETGYALSRHCKEALSYIKSRFHIDPREINPPGLNLNNGILELSYNDKGKPSVKLLPHSPTKVFTYKSLVNYDPNADGTACNEMMDAILPDASHQSILFQTLGASLDLRTIRKKQGRAVRVLFLLGEGSNGKDTLRECVSHIYGGQGVTSISLQAFKAADKERSFGLYSLLYSKINWSSENTKVSIDSCQTLKSIVSGDEITIEEKHKQCFAIRPETVVIFNFNEMPALESQKEAIQSRYALLPFQSIFKANPDPSKPREKKSDPRLKDDPQYLREAILSAFLNRMIQGLFEVLSKGIDYTAIQPLMEQVCENNSHLQSFIRETNLVECSTSQGIQTSKLYNHYEEWCKQEGLMVKDLHSSKITYHDPNPYDRVITNPRQFTKRLKECFPTLEPHKTSTGSILPLGFKAEDSDLDL